jgi:hypothetical protein
MAFVLSHLSNVRLSSGDSLLYSRITAFPMTTLSTVESKDIRGYV